MHVDVELLCHFQVTLEGAPARFATDYTRALLAYLAVETRAHERATLAALLWPEQPEAAARQNLRQALVYLKQALRDHPQLEQLLEITAKSVRLLRNQATVDVHQFRQLWAECATHAHGALATCPDCVARLRQAVALYRGEFLKGFFVKNNQPFEEWALFVREQLHRQAIEALHALTLHAESVGDFGQMQFDATRQLTLAPWNEEAHRQTMRALALSGQTTAALAHYAVCQRVLADEFGAPPSAETTQLYEQIKHGAFDRVTLAKPAASSHLPPATFPHNLPANLPPLVGRVEQLEQLRQKLLAARQALVTLVGMGGVGKTRLAQALIEQLVAAPPAHYPQGAWLIPLVEIEAKAADLPRTLAEVVLKGLKVPQGEQADRHQQLLDALAGRQLLLVLDNFEHLLADETTAASATQFVRTLLQSAPGVSVLVTSRMALQLPGEQVIRLEGLPVPLTPMPAGASVDSVRLFVQQAQRYLPSFVLDAGNLADVVEICRLVSGLPLGITLAATLAPHHSAAEIVRTLRENLATLVSTRRDLDERHQRLTMVFESSWGLLSAREQRILAQLSIFVGRFRRVAAQAVTEAQAQEIIGLVEQSLIQQPAVGLYELHEMVRQFAAEKLTALGAAQADALQARYAQYFLGAVAEQAESLRQHQPQAVAQFALDHENCRRAWQIALDHQWFDLLDASIAGLLYAWRASGRYAEGEALVSATLPALQPLATRPDVPYPIQHLWMQLWLAYADCQYGQSQYKGASEAATTAATLASALGDEPNYARGLITLSESLSWLGLDEEARPLAERAYALAQQHTVLEVEIRSLLVLASYQERVEQRLYTVAQALQLAQQAGDAHFELICTQNLAGACENAGYYARSLPYRTQALHLASQTQDHYQIGDAHYLYGLIHTHLGVYATALEHFQKAFTLAQEHRFTWLEKRTLNRMAMIHYRLGNLDSAYQLSAQARAKRRANEEPSSFAEFIHGQILSEQGRLAEAALVFGRILAQKRAQTSATLARLLPKLAARAQLALRQGELPQALTEVEEILRILASQPHISMSDFYFDRFAVDLACYQVLHAAQDGRAAAVLAMSYQLLMAQVQAIDDVELRQSYLEQIVSNRELVAAWQRVQAQRIPHNLPLARTSLVGRAREVAELVALVQQPALRLLTLVGPGGVGKSRLAVAVGQALAETAPMLSSRFADGIFFVSLAATTSAAGLAPAIATTLGLTLQGQELHQSLLQALSHKRLLLILDNFEQLLPLSTSSPVASVEREAVHFVVALLQAAPHLQILITARARLNLQSEQLYGVQGLAFSPTATIEDATTWAAIELFVQSAHRVEPYFTLTEANLPDLLRICQLVQGMPLGLEMAAARVDQLPLAAIAHAIEQSLDFLAVEWHDVPARQRSMRAVFDWSWRLLTEAEQRVLRQLSVFRGGFTHAAAEAIAGASVPMLNSLINKSLLRRTQAIPNPGETAEVRYELHELLRQFAHDQLRADAQEAVLVATRHSEFYLTFVAGQARRLARDEPYQAMTAIQAELDNVRQAWGWAVDSGASALVDQSAYSLWQFYVQSGLSTEGAQNFQRALARLMVTGQNATGDEHPDLLVGILSKLRAFAAHLLTIQGAYARAAAATQLALAEAERASDSEQQIEGKTLGHLAWSNAYYFQSEYGLAQAQCELALHHALAFQSRYPHNELLQDVAAQAELFIGAIARSMGDYPQARHHFTQAFQRFQQHHKRRGEVHAQINLAFTLWLLREDAAARQAYEQVLIVARQLGYHWGEGVALYELASVVRSQGEYSLALAYWQEASPILSKCADPLRQVYILANLTTLYCYLGDFVQAERWHAQLMTLRQTFHPLDGERMALAAIAHFYHAQGKHQQALDYALQGWRVVERVGSRAYQATVLTILGHIQASLGMVAEAIASYTQALSRYQALGSIPQAADAQAGLAQLALAQGDLAQARTESLLATLADHPRAGIDEPFGAYLACWRVLAATHDPRADTLLQTAYRLLQEYAHHLHEDALRHSFLTKVPTHCEVQALYQQRFGTGGE
jgi:predicted ATPase/DNA-binding SARP family transcriptional activator